MICHHMDFTMTDGTVVGPHDIGRDWRRHEHKVYDDDGNVTRVIVTKSYGMGKYDGPIAEYLDFVGADYEDESTGSVEWCEYVQRFGKRLLFTDDRGFVTCERFASEQDAIDRFQTIDAAYGAWLGR